MIQELNQITKKIETSKPLLEKEKRVLKFLIQKKAKEEKDYPSIKIYKTTLFVIFFITIYIFINYGFFKVPHFFNIRLF